VLPSSDSLGRRIVIPSSQMIRETGSAMQKLKIRKDRTPAVTAEACQG
jgi:hypothetical protein